MPMSSRAKWISFFLISVVLFIILFLVYSCTSRPRCEKDGEYMLEETGECFPPRTRGPCHENQVFMPDEPKGYGSCNCPYMLDNRAVLYHRGQCHHVFTQAFCPDGHWLTVTPQGEPICEENLCLEHSTSELKDKEWVPLKDGRCVQLGKWLEGCPSGAVVRFHRDYIYPSCFEPPPALMAAIGVRKYPCSLGSYRSITGKCQPKFQFDFE